MSKLIGETEEALIFAPAQQFIIIIGSMVFKLIRLYIYLFIYTLTSNNDLIIEKQKKVDFAFMQQAASSVAMNSIRMNNNNTLCS